MEEASAETPDLTVAILPRSGKVTLLQASRRMVSYLCSDRLSSLLLLLLLLLDDVTGPYRPI
jgi:hypothetical protein